MTIAVRNGELCDACGGTAINNKETGELAAKWRRAVNMSQGAAGKKMRIGQSFYSALELGKRNWTPKLVTDFEAVMLPLLNERKIDAGKL